MSRVANFTVGFWTSLAFKRVEKDEASYIHKGLGDGAVRQMCMGARRSPAEAKGHLKSHCKRLNEGSNVVIVSEEEHGPCML
eukprot:scaffold79398_cov16-Tisochrysis_lutea.AAC.2